MDFSGYYGELVYENAYDAIRLFEEGISNTLKYYVLKHGFSSMINKLVCKIQETSKNHSNMHNLYLNQELLKIKELGNTYVLNINNYIYQTKYLILALPKPALIKLNYLNKYEKELNSINCKPLCRIYSIFPKPWFKNLEKSTTNTKLRYIIPIDKKTGLIMIAYVDSKYALYWKKFLNKLNKELNQELLKQLNLLYIKEEMKKLNIKAPVYNSINYWNCGVGYWKPKVNSKIISKKILKLNKKRNYI